MGRPASPDYWRHWRAAHPAYRDRERERARARRRAGYRSPKSRRPRVVAEPVAVAIHPLLTWAQELAAGPRPRGPPRPPLRRALSRRRQRDRPRSSGAAGPGRTSHRLAAARALLAPPRRAAARGRLSRGWLAHGSAPVGAARPTPAPVAGPRRTSAAATAAAARASRTASAARPTIRSGGRSAWRRLAKRTVEAWVARPRLDLPGLASRGAPGATRRARGRPSRAARPRWRAAAGSAGRPLLELQRAEGAEPAAALSLVSWARVDVCSRRGPDRRGARHEARVRSLSGKPLPADADSNVAPSILATIVPSRSMMTTSPSAGPRDEPAIGRPHRR